MFVRRISEKVQTPASHQSEAHRDGTHQIYERIDKLLPGTQIDTSNYAVPHGEDRLQPSPTIKTTLIDRYTDATYQVFAYRRLMPGETVQAIAHYLTHANRLPKAGAVVKIVTAIGRH